MEQGAVDLGIPGLTDAVEVARGGFSTIYRATQRAMERTVAVKLIHATVVDPVAGEHFLREVRATGRLSQHPNVAPVYDVGTTASAQPYLIMPYYEHGSLQRHLDDSGALSEQDAVRLARTLASTLDYVHQRGILHRDIKPANVLLTEADEPLLADFGVARLVDGSVPVHTTGANVVTWAYGPPEAFTGGDPTPAWDIYSLGATVYAMLTGNPPFVDGEDVNVFTVLNRIGNVEVPDLRDRGVSAPVADAVRKTMSKDPTERPASAAAFAALLARPLPPPRLATVAPVVPMVERESEPAPIEPQPEPLVEPVAEPEPAVEPEPVVEPVVEVVQPVAEVVEPEPAVEPEPEPVSVIEPVAVVGPEPIVDPEPEPEPVVAVAARELDAEPEPAPSAQPARPGPGGARIASSVKVLSLLIGAAVVLSFVALRRPLFWYGSGSPFDDGLGADLGAWAPTVALAAGLPLLWARRHAGGEWLIGAGAAFVLINVGGTTVFLIDYGEDPDGVAMFLRWTAALLVVVAVVVAWRFAELRGPRIGVALAVLLAVGALIALSGSRDHANNVGSPAYAWLDLALVAVLLVRAFALPGRTTGGPALVAAGAVAVLAALESWDRSGWEPDKRDPLIALAVGFAIIAVVGAIRWRQSQEAPSSAPAGISPSASRNP